MSTIRIRSPASYWLAVPAAAWMLGVVVVPIVLLVWVSFWGGRAFSTASPLTFDNYAKFFANTGSDLYYPIGIAFGPDNNLYVATRTLPM